MNTKRFGLFSAAILLVVAVLSPPASASGAPIGTGGGVSCSSSSASANASSIGVGAATSASTGLALVASHTDGHADYPAPGAAVYSTASSTKTGLWPSHASMSASNIFGSLTMGCDLPPVGTEKIAGVADKVKVTCRVTSDDWNGSWTDTTYDGRILVTDQDVLWFLGTATTEEGTSSFAMPMSEGATFHPGMTTTAAPSGMQDSGLTLTGKLAHVGSAYSCNAH
ncbi:MAG: hypothetical protein V4510_10485 [bacterium]